MDNSTISSFSPTFQAIKQCIVNRWNEADIRPLPADDREGQVLFFAGMADEAENNLNDAERKALRTFIYQLVGIDEDQ